MAVRKIIRIDESRCNGCGACITGCPEGALEIIDGKARLVRESFCDGLGACIGECPTGALSIEKRDSEEFNEKAVAEHMGSAAEPFVCPGAMMRRMERKQVQHGIGDMPESALEYWPVQLALVPSSAPFLMGADVVLCADCVPFALAGFHRRFLAGGNPVLVACSKLDDTEPYVEKLADIFTSSGLKNLTIVHMEVPCCSGLCVVAKKALGKSGAGVEVTDVTVSIKGEVVSEFKW